MIKYITCALIILFSCCLSTNSVQAITYDFIKIVESVDDHFENLRGGPSINNDGTVVYYDNNTLYKYDSSSKVLFTAIRSLYSSISFYPSLNNSGTSAFGVFSVNGLWGIISSNGTSTMDIIDNKNNQYTYISSIAEINDNGYVSGWARIGSNNHIIYLSNGKNLLTLADTSGIYHTLSIETSINNNNFVAFSAYYTGGIEIVVSNGTSSEIITDTSGQFSHFNWGGIAINDYREVAFRAALDNGGEAVVLADKNRTLIIADTSSEFESFNNGGFDGVSVNNMSEVVFWGKVNGNGGLYIGGESCKVKVVQIAEKLNGDVITDLFTSNEAINDSGQIVFKATLKRQDESIYNAIYIANPSARLTNTDIDGDNAFDCMDNCPSTSNGLQEDMDNDGIGDACDTDADGDGFVSVLHGGQDSNDLDGNITPDMECGPDGSDLDYDGNNDGVPDSTQAFVISMHTFDHSEYVTIASPDVTLLSWVSAEDNPASGDDDSPDKIDFPYGFFNFTINNVAPGGSTTATLYLPTGASPTMYYKYGPTPSNATPHWYEFMYDSETGTGAEISGNTITLHFVDGLLGDDDLDATNGIIVDLGAPGASISSSDGNDGSSGGGGGCFISEVFNINL